MLATDSAFVLNTYPPDTLNITALCPILLLALNLEITLLRLETYPNPESVLIYRSQNISSLTRAQPNGEFDNIKELG